MVGSDLDCYTGPFYVGGPSYDLSLSINKYHISKYQQTYYSCSDGNNSWSYITTSNGIPICPKGSTFNKSTSKCISACPNGQFLKNGSCISLCKPPFIYKYDKSLKKSYCVNSNIDKSICQKDNFYWFDNTAFRGNPFASVLPTGCYYKDVFNDYINQERVKLLHALTLSYLPELGVEASSVDSGSYLLARFRKIFAGAKSLWDFIRDKFSSNPVNSFQDLSNQHISVQDLRMTDKGVEPVIDLTPLEDLPSDAAWSVPDNVATSSTSYDGTMPVDTFDFSSLQQTPSKFDDMPSEIPSYTDNILGTKDILDNSQDLSSYLDSATQINTPVKAKIDLSDSLVNPTQTHQFDLDTVEISKDESGAYPITKYKATIKYSDGSSTIFNIVRTDMGKNGQTYDITTYTPLKNGDVFQKTYHIQKSSSGTVINSFQDPSTIAKVNPDGSTEVVSNSSPDLSISKTKSEISLIPITTKLQEIEAKQDITNQELGDIDNNFKDMIDYKPPVNDDFDSSLNKFKVALTNYDLNMSNFVGYLSNFKNSLQHLKTNFDNSKNILEKKPSLALSSGSCGFNFHAFNQNYRVDPCMFITPYRPILVVFFTLVGTFAVIMFAVKFLISKGAE